jgi:hypothetical protein
MLIKLLKTILSAFEELDKKYMLIFISLGCCILLNSLSIFFKELNGYVQMGTIIYSFLVGGYLFSIYRLNQYCKLQMNDLIYFTNILSPAEANDEYIEFYPSETTSNQIKVTKKLALCSEEELEKLRKWAVETEEYKFAQLCAKHIEILKNKNQ